MTADKFSERFGYRQPDADITIREEAPEEVGSALVQLAYGSCPNAWCSSSEPPP